MDITLPSPFPSYNRKELTEHPSGPNHHPRSYPPPSTPCTNTPPYPPTHSPPNLPQLPPPNILRPPPCSPRYSRYLPPHLACTLEQNSPANIMGQRIHPLDRLPSLCLSHR